MLLKYDRYFKKPGWQQETWSNFVLFMKKAFLQLHLAILLAGFTGILGKLIHLNEGYLVWYRMLMSTLILLAIFIFTHTFKMPEKNEVVKLLGIGVIVSLHWVSFYGSIKYSNVSVSVTCLSAIGFFTSFIEPVINQRRIDWVEVGLGILAICGIYLIFNFYPEYKTGIIFGMISALLASIFPILNKRMLKKHTPRVLNFYEMGGGAIALCAILPVYLHFFPASYAIPTASDWFWLFILAAFCTVWAFDLNLKALQQISAFTVNLSYNFEPVYSIVMAFIIFKENQFLGAGFYAGFALILLAVSLQMVRVRKERKINERRTRVIPQ